MTIEYIEWEDSQAVATGWHYMEDLDFELPVMKSIGWVVKEDPTFVVLSANIGEETPTSRLQGNGIMLIPKRCIVKRFTMALAAED